MNRFTGCGIVGKVRRATLVSLLFIAAYFLWFAFDGTRVGWTEDDGMNFYIYWKPGFAKVVQSNLTFWTGFYRPLGGLFYSPIYAVAGMNPKPYRWVDFLLLALNTLLIYRLAWKLSAGNGRLAALASLFGCVHGMMADLVYNTSSIYDVMAVTFSLLSLIVYTGRPMGIKRFLAVLVLMVLALNAKEIAATLPAFFLLYEVLLQPPSKMRRNAWWSFVALAVAGIAMYGKMHGPEAMTMNEAYRPVFTFSRWLDTNVAYTGAILYHLSMSSGAVIGLWILMVIIAAVSKSRVMAWALFVMLLSTIPISFIPKRVGGSLYLPLIGWAIWFAAFFDWLISWLPNRFGLRNAATLVLALVFWRWTAQGFTGKGDWWRRTQATPNRVMTALENLHYQPPHGKRILFLGSPYKNVYDLVFLSNMVWNDRSLNIDDAIMTPDHGADQSAYDIVIAFEGDRLRVLKQ